LRKIYNEYKKVLECSSRGDTRFSPFFAIVEVFSKWDCIENHYQLSKRFKDENPPKTWRDCKGKNPLYIIINNKKYDKKFLKDFYKLMWVQYLDNNPKLVDYLLQYDDYSDMFKTKDCIVCQADVIRQYIRKGREDILNECKEFINLLREND